ncbi:MAG: hypothetical protein GTN99_08015 [Candidatus Dadabacteria bacterium]|nr:hypothetical protein [Candidatus Dadabacteria bacterium]
MRKAYIFAVNCDCNDDLEAYYMMDQALERYLDDIRQDRTGHTDIEDQTYTVLMPSGEKNVVRVRMILAAADTETELLEEDDGEGITSLDKTRKVH